MKTADQETLSLSTHPAFLKIVRRARAEVRRGKVVSLGEMKRELEAQDRGTGTASHRKRTQTPRR